LQLASGASWILNFFAAVSSDLELPRAPAGAVFLYPGSNPMNVSFFNARAAKFYNLFSGLVHIKSRIIFFALQLYVHSEVV
jgi:hypothetical protein